MGKFPPPAHIDATLKAEFRFAKSAHGALSEGNQQSSRLEVRMEVALRPIWRIVPHARNAREIPPSVVDKVAASFREFGCRQVSPRLEDQVQQVRS
jgi:hypothetical protein